MNRNDHMHYVISVLISYKFELIPENRQFHLSQFHSNANSYSQCFIRRLRHLIIKINNLLQQKYHIQKYAPFDFISCHITNSNNQFLHFNLHNMIFSGSLPDYKVVKAVPVLVVEEDPRKETRNSKLIGLIIIFIIPN